MIAIVSLLAVLFLELLIQRIAEIALVYTGLSSKSARFQARSALSGCGFTTSESEQIMRHPLRRRIIMHLMLIGNIGFIATTTTILLGVAEHYIKGGLIWIHFAILVAGLFFLLWISNSRFFLQLVGYVFSFLVTRGGLFHGHDLTPAFTLRHGFQILEIVICPDSPWIGKPLHDIPFDLYQTRLLGIQGRNGAFQEVFEPARIILEQDVITVFGSVRHLKQFANSGKPNPKKARTNHAAYSDQNKPNP